MDTQPGDALVGVPLELAAGLIDVPTARVRRWLDQGVIAPDSRIPVSASSTVILFGFDQLIELSVIRELQDRCEAASRETKIAYSPAGFMRRLRQLLDQLSEEDPLRLLEWGVEPNGRLAFKRGDGTWAGEQDPNQFVISDFLDLEKIRATVRSRLHRDESKQGRIEKRRGVHGSRPVFAGTRTPVSAVETYIIMEYTDDDILTAYPHLTLADIDAVRSAR